MSTHPVSAASLMAQEIAAELSRIGVAQKRLYTRAEAAHYLRISESTVNKLFRDGRLKEVDILESQPRFDVKDLDRLIEESKR